MKVDFYEGEKRENSMVLGEGALYSLDDIKTRRNNNVILCGSPGSGKTSLIRPNLYQAVGSYVISDPKGRLYKEFAGYFKKKGYRVCLVDFKNMSRSNKYNPFHYLHDTNDILSMAYLLSDRIRSDKDPFWDECAAMLYSAIISYLKEAPERMQTMRNLIAMLTMASTKDAETESELDLLFNRLEAKNPEAWGVKQYKKYRCMPTRTLQSVLITAQSKMLPFENPEINELTSCDDIELATIGIKKTVVFVIVSDVDRSMDSLANLFFTQCIQELVRYADDKCEEGRLPVEVRLFLDDFGTNLYIRNFEKFFASFRSRGLSAWLAIQAESQLEKAYGVEATTIIGSADNFVYLGGNDLESAKMVAERSGKPVQQVLGQKIGYNLILRRGEEPQLVPNYDMEKHRKEYEIDSSKCILGKKGKIIKGGILIK